MNTAQQAMILGQMLDRQDHIFSGLEVMCLHSLWMEKRSQAEKEAKAQAGPPELVKPAEEKTN